MNSQPDLYNSLKKRQQINRYTKWMYNCFKSFLGNRILDIGSGTGNIISHYVDGCEKLVAIDIFQHQIDYIKDRFKRYNHLECFVFDIEKDDITELRKYNFDTITCINVLEHIENDLEAVNKMKDVLSSKGKIIILVPAFSKVYGTMDKACGHFRRYNRNDLSQIAEKLNLKIVLNRYMNPLGLLPWFFKGRILKKKGTFSDDLNMANSKAYNLASLVLEAIEKVVQFPFGISQIVVLERE